MGRIIESSCIIDAPSKIVWEILVDFDQYSEWNPFTPKIELEKKIGSSVILHVNMNLNQKKLIRQKETLLEWNEGQNVNWGITNSMLIQTVRIQSLTSIDENKTKYYTSDSFKGILSHPVLMIYGKRIQKGFDAVGQALKKRSEATFHQISGH